MPDDTRGQSVDYATVAGFLIAVGCLVGGLLLEGGKIADIQQSTAALIVLGGTFGAVLVSTPLPTFLAALQRCRSLFLSRPQPFAETLELIIRLAENARRHGVASLETSASEVADPFLSKALNLAVDGTDLREIREMMRLQLNAEEERAEAEIRVWETAAGYSPTIGIIGAVLGLIQVMKHLDNIDEVGRGIAVAFVATVYGVAAANLAYLPIAGKLRARDREAGNLRELMLEGTLAIGEGMNPKLIRDKLSGLIPPGPRSPARRIPPASSPAGSLVADS